MEYKEIGTCNFEELRQWMLPMPYDISGMFHHADCYVGVNDKNGSHPTGVK